MAELTQYEKERAKNIERNQAHLASLGLLDFKIVPKNEPKAPKQRSLEPLSSEPTRASSRLAGKEVDYTYAESARFLDELDPDEDLRVRKKRGRPNRQPERYENEDYEQKHRRKRTVTNRPDPGQHHEAMVARLLPQPAMRPSRQKLIELREAGVTEEQLVTANYPQDTRDAYNDLLTKYPLRPTSPSCDYYLMPFHLYGSDFSGKFKVQCAKCKEYYCLNKQGKIHMHSRCEQIAKVKKEEALKTGANDS
ncbi:MAG: hypothetical protein CL608_02520 [Anaerolineaceae bacterium]|nr:hypothetical protein [Anaerolineaceae bacterium]|tara:strand:+ start:252 stop:1004 length:753 start_codon:yes stop_codon:yes gene_type:complete